MGAILLLGGVAFCLAGALYILLRWRRAPQAYRAMIALSVGYFAAGMITGLWAAHFRTAGRERQTIEVPAGPATQPTASLATADSDYLPLSYSGKVVAVTDGDTIDVALAPTNLVHSVRLAGIDAPESEQAFGADSTRHLSGRVAGKAISLRCKYERSYGRLICKVLLQDGSDVCLEQLKAGMAWHYKQYQDDQSPPDRATYGAAECAAMKAKVGLWNDPHPVQPQDFRHGTNSPPLYDSGGCRTSSEPTSGPVLGNARTHIFQWSGCPYYGDISSDNQVPFPSPRAAIAAGYHPAHNCP